MLKFIEKMDPVPRCDGRALDFVKIAAAVFMVIDHINVVWLHDQVPVMTFIGRGTFPLFCYAIAVAVLKVKERAATVPEAKASIKKYFWRLLAFGLLTQPVYFWAVGDRTVNVMFTLALGVVFAAVALRIGSRRTYALYALALLSMLFVLPVEFGLCGVALPSAFIFMMKREKYADVFLLLLLLFINAAGLLQAMQMEMTATGWLYPVLTGVFSVALPWFVLDAARNMQQTGRWLPKYALHVFYPAHLALIKLAAVLVQ